MGGLLGFLNDGGEPFFSYLQSWPQLWFPLTLPRVLKVGRSVQGEGCPPQPPLQGRVSPHAGGQWSEAQVWEPAEGKAASCSFIPPLTLCFQLNAQRKLSQLSAQRCGYKSSNLLKDCSLSLSPPFLLGER